MLLYNTTNDGEKVSSSSSLSSSSESAAISLLFSFLSSSFSTHCDCCCCCCCCSSSSLMIKFPRHLNNNTYRQRDGMRLCLLCFSCGFRLRYSKNHQKTSDATVPYVLLLLLLLHILVLLLLSIMEHCFILLSSS